MFSILKNEKHAKRILHHVTSSRSDGISFSFSKMKKLFTSDRIEQNVGFLIRTFITEAHTAFANFYILKKEKHHEQEDTSASPQANDALNGQIIRADK